MVNWFSMALKDSDRSWLMNLLENSIAYWDDMCEQFVTNFRGTFDRPCTITDLNAI